MTPAACPLTVPAHHDLHHGRQEQGQITYEPPIPIGEAPMTAWLFTWAGVGQWVRPLHFPTDREHWVAVPQRRGRRRR